jgi:hypothetical protein
MPEMNLTGDFWRFTYERQRIWWRRSQGLPHPWTEDPVLQRYRFTNVHRELDTGTQVLRTALSRDASLTDKVYNCMLYRVFNNVRAWRCIGWSTVQTQREDFALLRAYHEAGNPVFTAAWVISPLTSFPGHDRLAKVEWAVRQWKPEHLVTRLSYARSLRDVHQLLSKQRLMGQFTAFQVALDLTYVFKTLSDDEWVLTYSSAGKKAKAEYADAGSGAALAALGQTTHELRDHQDEALSALGLRWSDVAWSEKPRCTLADVEHTLCEFNKYQRILAGHVKGARSYAPKQA